MWRYLKPFFFRCGCVRASAMEAATKELAEYFNAGDEIRHDVVERLLARGADANLPMEEYCTRYNFLPPIRVACRLMDEKLIDLIVSHSGAACLVSKFRFGPYRLESFALADVVHNSALFSRLWENHVSALPDDEITSPEDPSPEAVRESWFVNFTDVLLWRGGSAEGLVDVLRYANESWLPGIFARSILLYTPIRGACVAAVHRAWPRAFVEALYTRNGVIHVRPEIVRWCHVWHFVDRLFRELKIGNKLFDQDVPDDICARGGCFGVGTRTGEQTRSLYQSGLTYDRLKSMPVSDLIFVREAGFENDDIKALLHNARRLCWRMYRNFAVRKWHPSATAVRGMVESWND